MNTFHIFEGNRFAMDSNYSSRPQKASSDQVQSGKSCVLILHNDEVNTFEHVMEALIDICEHNPTQAEQCATIAHFKGKCDILSGEMNSLREIRIEMTSRGINTTIES